MARVLLIEDDNMIGAAVQQALKDAAYAIEWAKDSKEAAHALETRTYELVLLDLGLPMADRREMLCYLRGLGGKLPVIIVTARDSIEDNIKGLDLSADDCLTEPFEIRELLARIRAALRRDGSGFGSLLDNGKLSLDTTTREACYLGKSATLSAREFALLRALLARPGTILSRSELEQDICGGNKEDQNNNTIELLVQSVREKLGSAAVHNLRGAGWMVERAS